MNIVDKIPRANTEVHMKRGRLATRKYWLRWIPRLLLTFLLLGLLLRLVDPAGFWKVMRSADLVLLSVAVTLFFPGKLMDAYRWYFILSRLGRVLPFWLVVQHSLLGQLSAMFLPGQVSGDAVRLIAVAHGQPRKAVFVLSVVIDKFVLLLAVVAFTFLGLLGSGPVSNLSAVYVAAGVIFLVASSIFILLCLYRDDNLSLQFAPGEGTTTLVRRWLLGLKEWLSPPRLSHQATLIALALGLALQLIYTIGSYILALSMHIVINPIDWAAINAIVSFLQIFPLTIGGLGVREGAFAMILTLYGVPTVQAIAFSLTGFILLVFLTIFSWLILNLILSLKGVS